MENYAKFCSMASDCTGTGINVILWTAYIIWLKAHDIAKGSKDYVISILRGWKNLMCAQC